MRRDHDPIRRLGIDCSWFNTRDYDESASFSLLRSNRIVPDEAIVIAAQSSGSAPSGNSKPLMIGHQA
jgi:hypothetical protein